MTDNTDYSQIPTATAEPKKRAIFSVVWIIPILAAVVALGIAIEHLLSEGPTITIVFKSAEGIEAGKTFIKYKDVNIGQVIQVKLSENYQKVVVTAKIDKSAEGLLVGDAKFWVVRPRVTLSGISGMSTLLSGNFIAFEAGNSSTPRFDFQALDIPPLVMETEPGRQFVLRAPTLGSLGIGSPLYYRQLNVGRVIAYDLAGDGKSVNIRIFVDNPYENYVTEQTCFWQASGIDVSLGASGLNVKTQSVLSLLIGGIAFETPPSVASGQPAEANTVFTLYQDRTTAMSQEDQIVVHYTLYFNESLRGLAITAPVTLHGLPIGQVTAVELEYPPAATNPRPRVEIALFPRRFMKHADLPHRAEGQRKNCDACNAFLQKLVNRGLRAQLRSANLLLGHRFIALDFFPGSPPADVDWRRDAPILPIAASDLVDFEGKINTILSKLEKIPYAEIGEEMKETFAVLNKTVGRVESELLPEAQKAMGDLRRALDAAEKILASSEQHLVGRDAPVRQELREALQEITRAARAIAIFTEYLEQNPAALIRGKAPEVP
ncbi:MAG: MlaD family protein [Syntrophales bacterium]|jgi:paraquat-inducible protein B|nr:MlaD family protein [Syntrophales bacterium]